MPAKRGVRKSVSVNRRLYERFKAKCEAGGFAMSAVVEGMINQFLEKEKASALILKKEQDALIEKEVDDYLEGIDKIL